MSIISPTEYPFLPKAFNGCTCDCHRHPGVMHVMACCYPTFDPKPVLEPTEPVVDPKPE